MSIDQELKNIINAAIDSWSDKFLTRLVNILTNKPNVRTTKPETDKELSQRLYSFIAPKPGEIILFDVYSKLEIGRINSCFLPITHSIISLKKFKKHICNSQCDNGYVCDQELDEYDVAYQVVDYPTLKNNYIIEVFVKQI